MSNIPAELKYSNDHEWCRVEGEFAYVGITDFAQSELGDIVFVDIQSEGESLAAGDAEGYPEDRNGRNCRIGREVRKQFQDRTR